MGTSGGLLSLCPPPAGARKLTEDSSRRRAIAEGSGNNRGRFFCKNRRIDNTLLVVEGKTTGLRRRWIAWPRDKNRNDAYEANFPFLHISHYLPPVMAEAASLPGLKGVLFASPFTAGDSASILMPRGGRHAGGADTAPNSTQGRPTNSPDYYYFGQLRW
ncbi:hypothetical protein C3747_410g17 [Trypanosoma cruzi]|uniref:Uncharacterized protein n=1 Tax=Trypanosoma cruzi TaxID=5693 RepID=A0A2V2UYH3_TRYCR|nr:hypothetical protein C3747_410g17 [Trypanosoma cruzi]